jgi:hypothetical protein
LTGTQRSGDPVVPVYPDSLRHRLAQAYIRRDSQPPFSPDWDAAMSLVEELEERLMRSLRDVRDRHRPLVPSIAG